MNAGQTIEAALRGAAGWGDSDRVDRLLAGHRAEVVAERDAEIMRWLGKKAREYRAIGRKADRERADLITKLASQISRGAVRPNNTLLPAGVKPEFFEPGRTYQFTVTSPSLLVTIWTLKVTSVGPPPDGGQPVALGWRRKNDEPWEPGDADDLTGWTEVAEPGEATS